MTHLDDTLANAIGDLLVGAGADSFVVLPAGVPSYVLVVDPSSPHQLVWVSANRLLGFVMAHKGSLAVASSASQVREFPVGLDGQLLMADSALRDGIVWMSPSYIQYGLSLDFSFYRNSMYLPAVM